MGAPGRRAGRKSRDLQPSKRRYKRRVRRNRGDRLSRKDARKVAPRPRTVRLSWPVVWVLANHDNSDLAERGKIRPGIDIPSCTGVRMRGHANVRVGWA